MSAGCSGGVAIHIQERDSRGHGHDRDPAYDGVVLYVVWQADASFQTETSVGVPIPTASLEDTLNLPLEVLSPCGAQQ